MTVLPLAFVLVALAVVDTTPQCSFFGHVLDALLAAAETMFAVGLVAVLTGSQEPPKRSGKYRDPDFGKPQDRKPEKYGLVLLAVAVVLVVGVIALKQGGVSRHCLDGLVGFV